MDTVSGSARFILGGGDWFNRRSLRWIELAITVVETRGVIPSVGILVSPNVEEDEPDCGEVGGVVSALKRMGVRVAVSSMDTQAMPNLESVKDLVASSNILVVLGGNIAELAKRWRATGIDEVMRGAASDPDKVIVGASAGLAIWFKQCHTLERPYGEPSSEDYHLVDCLGVFDAVVCPHYWEFHPSGEPRSAFFRRDLERMPDGTFGVGVSTYMALDIDGKKITILGDLHYERLHVIVVRHGALSTMMLKAGVVFFPAEELFAA